jgi:hypothetical protein
MRGSLPAAALCLMRFRDRGSACSGALQGAPMFIQPQAGLSLCRPAAVACSWTPD